MNRKRKKIHFRYPDLKFMNAFGMTNLHDAVHLVVPQGLHHIRLIFRAPKYVGSSGTSEVWVSILVSC